MIKLLKNIIPIGVGRMLFSSSLFTLLGCSTANNEQAKFPQTVQQVSDEAGEENFENTLSACYESSYAGYGANRHIPRHEYISLNIKDTIVTGKGAGEAEGDPSWTFTCLGTLLNDTIIRLQVSYKIEGANPFVLNEEWHINKSTSKITVRNPSPKRPGPNVYNKIECGDLPVFYIELFKKIFK